MTKEQAKEIFEQHILGHWSNWPNTDAELYVWVKALAPFDFKLAQDAIDDFYAAWDSERYPKMPKILAFIRGYMKSHRRQGDNLGPLYQIEDETGRLVWRPFWGSLRTPQADIEAEADRRREEADKMFPDRKHIVHYLKPEVVPF